MNRWNGSSGTFRTTFAVLSDRLRQWRAERISPLRLSSSATIYRELQYLLVNEAHLQRVINAYGRSKHHIKDMLRDICMVRPRWVRFVWATSIRWGSIKAV